MDVTLYEKIKNMTNKEAYEKINNMTNKEAAELIKNLVIKMADFRSNGKSVYHACVNVALNKAIEALQKE